MEADAEVWRLLARWLSPSEAKLWRVGVVGHLLCDGLINRSQEPGFRVRLVAGGVAPGELGNLTFQFVKRSFEHLEIEQLPAVGNQTV